MNCTATAKRLILVLVVLVAVMLVTDAGFGQIRVVTYNSHKEPYYSTDPDWITVLQAIGAEQVNGMNRPIDVLAIQEVAVSSPSNPNTPYWIADMLNSIYGTTSYVGMRGVYGDGYNVQGYVYNSATLTLVGTDEQDIGTRAAYRATFRPVGYNSPKAEFTTYNVHLKAMGGSDNIDRRFQEARYLRNYAESMPADANLIYLGDFNFTEGPDSDEPGYTTMLAASDPRNWFDQDSQSFDPLNGAQGNRYVSTWNSSYPTSRLDYQFPSTELGDGEGMDLIDLSGSGGENSYHTFGVVPGGISPSQLSSASDHLPVVADYQVPALQSSWVDGEPTEAVLVGASVSVDVHLENVAPTFEDPDVDSDYEAAADDLDYEISGTAVSGGPITGSDVVGGGASVESVSLDTSTAGDQSGTIEIASDDEGQRDAQTGALLAQQTHNISYTVLDHANGSFDEVSDVDSVQIDLGLVAVGTGDVDELFAVWNLESMVGYTAELVISSPTALSGDTTELSLLDGSGTASAGGSVPQTARLSTSTAGVFQSLWEIEVSDEPLAGASTGTLEVELVGTVWVPGDFDLDLDVDVNDLLTWQGGYGTSDGATHSDGDADGDGDVDVNDLLMWQGNYSPGGSGGQPTPEPATLGVLALGGMALLRKKR